MSTIAPQLFWLVRGSAVFCRSFLKPHSSRPPRSRSLSAKYRSSQYFNVQNSSRAEEAAKKKETPLALWRLRSDAFLPNIRKMRYAAGFQPFLRKIKERLSTAKALLKIFHCKCVSFGLCSLRAFRVGRQMPDAGQSGRFCGIAKALLKIFHYKSVPFGLRSLRAFRIGRQTPDAGQSGRFCGIAKAHLKIFHCKCVPFGLRSLRAFRIGRRMPDAGQSGLFLAAS